MLPDPHPLDLSLPVLPSSTAGSGSVLGKHGSVVVRERRGVSRVAQTVSVLRQALERHGETGGPAHVLAQGLPIAIVDRLVCFVAKGCRCVACGLDGAFFALEAVESSSGAFWTLGLYGLVDGREVYFTKDHIQPKAQGGPDTQANYQPMCWPCNSRKGDHVDGPPSLPSVDRPPSLPSSLASSG